MEPWRNTNAEKHRQSGRLGAISALKKVFDTCSGVNKKGVAGEGVPDLRQQHRSTSYRTLVARPAETRRSIQKPLNPDPLHPWPSMDYGPRG